MKNKYAWGMNPKSRAGGFKKRNQAWKLRRDEMFADKNPQWKGKNVGYSGIHRWIKLNKPKPNYCEDCGKNKPLDLANISGGYKRNINDFKWLCRKCHMKSDGRYEQAINNIKTAKKCRGKNGRYIKHEE